MGRGSEYDVAIVGASLAGCTAATFLGRQGARVALIESHGDPRAFKRMCTHEIQGSAASTVERLGLLDEVTEAGGRRGTLNFWTRYGWVSSSGGPSEADSQAFSLNVRRETFDPILRELASGTEGVETMLGHRAVGLLRDGRRTGGVVVRDRDGAERELRAKLVVAADGRGSGIAKLAGQRTKEKANNRFAYFAYFRDTPLVTGDSLQLWFLDPDCVYAFPTDDDLTLLACVPHKDRLAEFKARPGGGDGCASSRACRTGPGSTPRSGSSKVLGQLDAPNEVRRPTAPGLAFVGDAATSADPVWGVGCGWALQVGEWLAEEAGPALRDGGDLDRALKALRAAATGGKSPATTGSARSSRTAAGSTPPSAWRCAPRPGTRSWRARFALFGGALDQAPAALRAEHLRPDRPRQPAPRARPAEPRASPTS